MRTWHSRPADRLAAAADFFAKVHTSALALDARAAALEREAMPPEIQCLLSCCRADLAVILAATEQDAARLFLDSVPVSFEALRGLVRPH
jgi:hypothetical protein